MKSTKLFFYGFIDNFVVCCCALPAHSTDYANGFHLVLFSNRCSLNNEDMIFLPTDKNNLILNIDKDKDKILQTLDLIQNTFNKNNNNTPNNNCRDSLQILLAI